MEHGAKSNYKHGAGSREHEHVALSQELNVINASKHSNQLILRFKSTTESEKHPAFFFKLFQQRFHSGRV